jgi:hypothetical protein
MEQNPQILHLSYRESPSDSEYKWLKVNIVFRVFDEHDRMRCDADASDWTKTYLWEVENPEAIHLHFLHTKMKWLEPDEEGNSQLGEFVTNPKYDISHLKRSGWQTNFEQLLTKTKKFDAYRYHEYVEDNLVTRGALKLLEELKENGSNGSRFVPFSTLIRSLRVLNLFWD